MSDQWNPMNEWVIDFKNKMWHKSHLQAWINCPWKLKRQYIDNVVVENELRSQNFFMGNYMHRINHMFWNKLELVMPIAMALRNVERLEQALAIIKPHIVNTALYIAPINPNLMPMVHNLARFEAMRWVTYKRLNPDNAMRYWVPVEVEMRITSPTLRRVGAIDRIERIVGRDTYALVEIKAKVGTKTNIRRELAWYHGLAEHAWGMGRLNRKISHWGAFGYKDGSKFFEPVKRISITAMEKRFVQFEAAVAGNDFPKKKGYLCMWCEYAGECYDNLDGWKEKFPDHDDNELDGVNDAEIEY